MGPLSPGPSNNVSIKTRLNFTSPAYSLSTMETMAQAAMYEVKSDKNHVSGMKKVQWFFLKDPKKIFHRNFYHLLN